MLLEQGDKRGERFLLSNLCHAGCVIGSQSSSLGNTDALISNNRLTDVVLDFHVVKVVVGRAFFSLSVPLIHWTQSVILPTILRRVIAMLPCQSTLLSTS